MTDRIKTSRSAPPPLAHMRALAFLALRDKGVIAVLVLAQLLFLLPMVASYPTGEEAICHERAVESAGIARDELIRYGSEFPEELLELTRQEYSHFSDAAAASYPSSEYFSALGSARETQDREWQAGYLTGSLSYRASATLLTELSELDNPQTYVTAKDLPALNYLALALGIMPAATLLLPGLLTAYAVFKRLHGHGLLAVAPLHEHTRHAGAILVGAVLSAVSPIAVALPSALVALVRNGLGDARYPVVPIMDGIVVSDTVLGTLGRDAALIVLEAIALALFVGLVSRASPRLALGLGLLALLLPLAPLYAVEFAPWHEVGSLLPTTYLSLSQVVGYPTYANGLDISVFPEATFRRGVTVLLVTTLTLIAVSFIATRIGSGTRKRRLGREDTDA